MSRCVCVGGALRLGPGRSGGKSASESTCAMDGDPEEARGGSGGGFPISTGSNKTKPLTASLLQLPVLPREVLVSTTQGQTELPVITKTSQGSGCLCVLFWKLHNWLVPKGVGSTRLPSTGAAQHLASCISASEPMAPCSQ